MRASPPALGRGVVVRDPSSVPGGWPRIEVTEDDLAPGARVEDLLRRLHVAWIERRPHVVVWRVDDDRLAVSERTDAAPWEVGPRFTFPLERLRFAIFVNNVDLRSGEPVWWWGRKAAAIGATLGGPADVLLPSGDAAWIDGGPRATLPVLDLPVVPGEHVDRGSLRVPHTPTGPAPGDLAPDQAAAVSHTAGPARIIAPAGSGKTRVLTARVHHLVEALDYDPAGVGAFAYNNRAAAEMRSRLAVAPRSVRTLHSLGWDILQRAHGRLELIDERAQRRILESLVSVPRRVDTDPMAPYLEALERTRLALVDPADVESERDDVPGFSDAFERYRRRLLDSGMADHGEQVYGAIEALLRDPSLRRAVQRDHRHVLVDEFQDLTPALLLLVRLVAAPEMDVFGVGDDDQVIYGYTGADPQFLIDYESLFPSAASHALEVNYRCPKPVVAAASTLLTHNNERIHKRIRASDDAPEEGLDVVTAASDTLATTAVARVVDLTASGVKPDAIAILSRVNSTLIPVKLALAEAGIATTDLLGPATIDRTVVKSLQAWMRVAASPDAIARSDLIAVTRRPGRGLTRLVRELATRSRYTIDEVAELGRDLDAKRRARWAGLVADVRSTAAVAAKGSAPALIDAILDDVGLSASAGTLDSAKSNAARSGHGDDLVAVRRAAALHPRLDGFWPWVRDRLATPPSDEGVTLSTIHRVKGLEWPHVIVFGADQGAMPHTLSDDVEEERRVFHVAITRSQRATAILADAARPSPFIAEMSQAAPPKPDPKPKARPTPTVGAVHSGDAPVPEGSVVRVTGGHRGVAESVTPDRIMVRMDSGALLRVKPADVLHVTPPTRTQEPEATGVLVDALRAWRLETARAMGVPAFVVFTDVTMNAIATAQPRNERDLLEISGIGPRKLEDYGDEILGIVATVTDS